MKTPRPLRDPEAASADGLPPLRDVIAQHGLVSRKSLGQNFILDLNLTGAIARAAGPLEGRTVIEVGPGPGGLTRALLSEGASKVIAIERDERTLPALEQISDAYPGRLYVTSGDALKADWSELLGESQGTSNAPNCDSDTPPSARPPSGRPPSAKRPSGKPLICANLPYGIATKLLIGWLETSPWPPWWDRMILMFQREVAERIVAAPGTKPYGRLSVISQWRCETRQVMTLPPEAFTPPPKVSSAVVEFIARDTPEPACNITTLGRVTAAAFGQRRKMLRASLKQLVAMPELLLERVNIDPRARAETLTPADFARLANALDELED